MAKELSIIPLSLKEANDFVTKYHRHNKKCAGHKWSIGAIYQSELVGVIIVGRPVARKLDNRFTKGQLPANYHLTFSRAEDNDHKLKEVLKHTSAAVVFAGELPKTWRGYPVIDGDEHDARFTDAGPGTIIGLTAKGKARHDGSGFVVPSHGTDSTWN